MLFPLCFPAGIGFADPQRLHLSKFWPPSEQAFATLHILLNAKRMERSARDLAKEIKDVSGAIIRGIGNGEMAGCGKDGGGRTAWPKR